MAVSHNNSPLTNVGMRKWNVHSSACVNSMI